mmetsp:Transcript_1932/g.7584  ORF Transcript_1932/g.7584 Transcript_1932/m.7584 type:complete len:329 (-) Transcript_1932:832-1818(-)
MRANAHASKKSTPSSSARRAARDPAPSSERDDSDGVRSTLASTAARRAATARAPAAASSARSATKPRNGFLQEMLEAAMRSSTESASATNIRESNADRKASSLPVPTDEEMSVAPACHRLALTPAPARPPAPAPAGATAAGPSPAPDAAHESAAAGSAVAGTKPPASPTAAPASAGRSLAASLSLSMYILKDLNMDTNTDATAMRRWLTASRRRSRANTCAEPEPVKGMAIACRMSSRRSAAGWLARCTGLPTRVTGGLASGGGPPGGGATSTASWSDAHAVFCSSRISALAPVPLPDSSSSSPRPASSIARCRRRRGASAQKGPPSG